MKGGPLGNKYRWKGGETKCNGYVYLYCPNHPQKNGMGKGYMKRARLVMEEHLGRYLKRSEFVHHINGIRDDDQLENLLLTNLFSHQSLHAKEIIKKMKRNDKGQFIKLSS